MIDLGDVAILDFQTIESGSYVDATSVTLTIELPDGTDTVLTPARLDVGRYRVRYPTVQSGRHILRWASTGTGQRAHTDVLNVGDTRPTALASLEEFKEHLNLTDPVEDEELRRYLDAATEVIEHHLGQVVARRTFTESRHVPRYGRLVLSRTPVLSIEAANTSDGYLTWDVEHLAANPNTGEITSAGYGLAGDITITYTAGYRSVPANLVLAAQIIAAHLWQTQRVQKAPSAPGFGGDDSPLSPTGLGYAIPARAVELLGGQVPVIA